MRIPVSVSDTRIKLCVGKRPYPRSNNDIKRETSKATEDFIAVTEKYNWNLSQDKIQELFSLENERPQCKNAEGPKTYLQLKSVEEEEEPSKGREARDLKSP